MRQGKLLIWGLLILFAMAIPSAAWAQTTIGPFEITGYYQYTINPATEHANRNNFTCLSFIAGPGGTPARLSCPPGLQRKAGKPDFLLMRQMLDLNIFGKFNENWSVTLEPRLIFDMTKIADSHFRQYDSFPTKFSGSGNLLEGGGNDFNAELRQAYLDYREGNWWLRIGKQQIAWGEALGLRVLDTVNPLDLRQNFGIDRIFEEFDKIRIPQWFIRANYTIPNESIPDLTGEFILNPGAVVPALLPAQGAPYNVVPSFLKIRDNVNQGEPTVGGRLTGTVSDVQFSVNFLTKPDDFGAKVFRTVFPTPVFPSNCLFPVAPPGLPCVGLENKHPRVYIVGGSVNYNWAAAGAILRLETTVTPDAPFSRFTGPGDNPTPTRIIERPVWKTVLAVDRPTYVIPGLDSMTIGFQFLETFTGGNLSRVMDGAGAKVDTAVHVFTVFFQQPILDKRVSLEFFGLFDTDDGHWLQPGVRWEIGNHVRLDLYYNKFGGAEKRPVSKSFGTSYMNFANGPYFRFTYGF